MPLYFDLIIESAKRVFLHKADSISAGYKDKLKQELSARVRLRLCFRNQYKQEIYWKNFSILWTFPILGIGFSQFLDNRSKRPF